MSLANNKIIITGAPGAGKTTLLNHLQSQGFHCYEEISRKVIKESLKIGNNILPWGDVETFSLEVLKLMLEQYKEEVNSYPIFCDRAIPDIITYLKFNNKKVPSILYKEMAKAKYKTTAFIAPPWRDIYVNDNERKENFNTAQQIFLQLEKFYTECNFQLYILPKTSVEKRGEFILKTLKIK